MKKIIQINSSSSAGGGPQVMWDIVMGLSDSFNFLVMSPEGYFLERYRKKELKVDKIRDKGLIDNIFKIRQIIQKEKPDIIHLHGTRTAIWGRLAVIRLKNKPKVVYTVHGFHILRKNFIIRFILLWLEKFLNLWTDILICVSRADKELVLERRAINSNKIKVIRNGIEMEKFRISPEQAEAKRKELNLGKGFVLISVGRLHPQKDFSTIIKAISLVSEDVKILIVGDGFLRKELEKEVEDLGLKSKVLFLGERNDVPELMALSDGVILSTNWEGLALVPLEAGAAGKAIIASRVGGVEESIINRETGFLFTKGSEKDLADKILKLYKSEELRERIGERARKHILDNFSKERMIQEHKILYSYLF